MIAMSVFILLVSLFCGIVFGVYIGHRIWGSDGMTIGDVRNRLQSLSDDVEVRLQDQDFETDKQWGMALGEMNAYYELMNYIDNSFTINE